MILFEYQCSECGKIYEIYQNIAEEKFDFFYCDKCNKIVPVKRLVGSTGFELKGGKWADTGYA